MADTNQEMSRTDQVKLPQWLDANGIGWAPIILQGKKAFAVWNPTLAFGQEKSFRPLLDEPGSGRLNKIKQMHFESVAKCLANLHQERHRLSGKGFLRSHEG